MSRVSFVTYSELAADTLTLANELRGKIVGVVGVPRSGMLAANMLALHLNLPCCSLDEFLRWQRFYPTCCGGERLGLEMPVEGHVIVLDDSIWMGGAIAKARSAAQREMISGSKFSLCYGAVYRAPESPKLSWLITVRELPKPRYFEWNLFHHPGLKDALFDMDGVLCSDPTEADAEDDLGNDAFARFVGNARPLHIPTVPIGGVVTARLEKWRGPTEQWLDRHGVERRCLVMHPAKHASERRAMRDHAAHKAAYYRESAATLFIESSNNQAPEIAARSGKPVICVSTKKVYQP